MKTMKTLTISAFFSASLMLLAGSVVAAPNDPAGGACDGLDPSSGLFSTCIQAHSAKNRVAHLTSVGASSNAIAKAQAQLDAAIAQYALLGDGSVPGFEIPVPFPGGPPAGTMQGEMTWSSALNSPIVSMEEGKTIGGF